MANLNQSKASGADNVPNWLFKEYSDILALTIMQILNASYREQRLPTIWKMADVPPLPKKKPMLNLKKDLRRISLTPCVSKVAEEFVVEDVVKPAVLDVLHANQYGATVRTMLFDYRKAFDFIDHSILIDKLCKLDIPRSVVNWIIDFLSDRFQRIKLAEGCFSEWGPVPSGVPQGTKLGLWLFVLMINDLDIKSPLM